MHRSQLSRSRSLRWNGVLFGALVGLGGCAAPVLTRDGHLVFQETGARGASVITAQGVEFMDRAELPKPVVRRSVSEPFKPATGFLLPKDGVLRRTSIPVTAKGPGLSVSLRSSDVFVPAWGGEVLLRLDITAPASEFPKDKALPRRPLRVAVVVDGAGNDTTKLTDALYDNLGLEDRVAVFDTTRARTVLPTIPGSHRTLLKAATEQLVGQDPTSRPLEPAARDLPRTLLAVQSFLSEPRGTANESARILVLTDGVGVAVPGALEAAVDSMRRQGHDILAVATTTFRKDVLTRASWQTATGLLDARLDAVEHLIPAPGEVAVGDVMVSLGSIPAPARVVEVSSGAPALGLYADHVSLGELFAGEGRTEVARVVLPPWVPGEALELTLQAKYRDVITGSSREASTILHLRYSADIEEIAEARSGDVIAYATSLAVLSRLDRAFVGDGFDRTGGLRRLATLEAHLLEEAGRSRHDPALTKQAEVLSALLGILPN